MRRPIFLLAGTAPRRGATTDRQRSAFTVGSPSRRKGAFLALVSIAALLALGLAANARAGEDDEPAATSAPADDGWTFEVTPYLWLPEQQGTLQVGRLSAPVDVDFSDLFDLLGNGELIAGMLHFEAHRGPLSLFLDGVGGTAQPTQQTERGTVKTTLNYAFVEFGPAYTVLDLPTAWNEGRAIQIDALIGGRFMYFYTEIDATGSGGNFAREGDAEIAWVDPFVGGRFRVPLVGGLAFFFRGDIGGFDLGSELAWNLVSGFIYELPWHPGAASTALVAGYKALDFDYTASSRARLALNMRGPALGLTFSF